MPDRLQVAIVGAGYFSQYHYEGWSRHARAAIVAMANRDPDRRARTAGAYAVPHAFATIEALLEAVRPDVLDIVTPPETHAAMVAAAAGAGVPVICQKPVAPTQEEAEAIVGAAEAAGIPFIIHENFRFQPWFQQARKLIDDGRLGALHSIAFRMRPGDGQGTRAYLDRQPYFQKMDRFLIHETGIHFVDTFRYLMGEVRAVTARLRRVNPVIAGEDAGYVVFEFDGGATGLFDGNRLNDHAADNCRMTMGEMFLEGAAGVLRLDGHGRLWFKPHGGAECEEIYAWEDRGFAGDCVYRQIDHIASHLLDGTPVMNTGRDYLRNVAIEEAIYRSSSEGRLIEV